MSSADKDGAEARNGLEKITSVDSIQKITNKVLPGIFSTSKVTTMAQPDTEKLSKTSSGSEEAVSGRFCVETRQKRVMMVAVLLLCCAGGLQGILVNGLINVVISTIEKRLDLYNLFNASI